MKRLMLALAIALVAAGCTQSVGAKMGDHQIVVRKTLSNSPNIAGNDYMSVVTLNGQQLAITLNQVTWPSGRTVALPDKWKKLEVKDMDGHLVVVVDGQTLEEPSRRPGF